MASEAGGTPQVLLGYSLGGRLAFHALLCRPELWSAAVIVSAHPGYEASSVCNSRIAADEQWARRFLTEPWDLLIRDWNAQSIFGRMKNMFSPEENDFSRELIALTFRVFSTGRQESLVSKLAELSAPPVLYLSGEFDTAYTALGSGLAKKIPVLSPAVIANTWHRAPWEDPEQFVSLVQDFLGKVLI